MLTSLRIENFAIVKELELDFAHGMTAFTGETGAGKSIMIDALFLALGGRAETSVIRVNEEKCNVIASFYIEKNSEPAQWLSQHDIECEDGTVLLRRVLTAQGRSKCYINGQPFPLQKVKELSELLVHIHGQHQHQTLMQHPTHRQQLDEYANHIGLVSEVGNAYKKCQQTKQSLDHFQDPSAQRDKMNLLQFQIEELSALCLQEEEAQTLHEEHQLLHHACDYLQTTQQISQLLNEDNEPNVCQGLNQILQLLAKLPPGQVDTIYELINSALIQADEAHNEIQKFSEQIHIDPQRLQEVENRLSVLHQMARKYHLETRQLSAFNLQLQENLLNLQKTEEKRQQLQQRYQQELEAFAYLAQKLSLSRQEHAGKLTQEITAIIQQLGMPQGRVEIAITALERMQMHGLDKVEYKVCTNPGTALDSLGKIASGGELSRISLAIQMVTARRGATPTLLFDEVDVGIGGATAALVGKLLRQLGERLQLFCVTHQPQVAACAHHHYVVEKYTDHQQTYSRIIPLSPSEKITEIARMLGGLVITEQTRLHAEELLVQD